MNPQDNIPQALKDIPRWVPWRLQPRAGRPGKFDKIPVSATPPHHFVGTTNPNARYSFEVAAKAAAAAGLAGVGFVVTGLQGFVGVDLDNCVNDGVLDDWAQEVVDTLRSYTEISPSGKGVRIWSTGTIEGDWTNHEVGIEVYGGHNARFLTVTGNAIGDYREITAAQGDAFDSLAMAYRKAAPAVEITKTPMPELLAELPDVDPGALPNVAVDLLYNGDAGTDRSRSLFRTAVALFTAGLNAQGVFSVLADNETAMWIALDHRGQSPQRALAYLWVEHCLKAQPLAKQGANLDDFEDLSGSDENTTLAGESIAEGAIKNEAKKNKFEVVPAQQFTEGAAPEWLIKGLLPKADLVVLFGESGSGKSFVALDIAGAIATGTPWRDMRTKQGRVAYIAAEGAGGFRNRVKAYAQANELDLEAFGANFGVIPVAPNMMLKDDALDVCRALKAWGKVDVVIVDTFAQVTPGANENSGEDVGRALQNCKGIHIATGAVVILVHHAGKDSSKGARGWSGLRAAADAEIEVIRTNTGRYIRNTKQKDGEDGGEWGFDLNAMPVGVDSDGDVVLSCVVGSAAVPVAPAAKKNDKGSGEWVGRVRDVLEEIGLAQTAGVEQIEVIKMVMARSPAGADNKRAARRALKTLLNLNEGWREELDGTLSWGVS